MLQIECFAESIWFPWERKQDKFEDIWDGSVISTSFDNNNIQPGDILFLQNRDGFCPLGINLS